MQRLTQSTFSYSLKVPQVAIFVIAAYFTSAGTVCSFNSDKQQQRTEQNLVEQVCPVLPQPPKIT
ncbi:hypothetical protein F7734_21370 [Scytonema sp. UIC 10036]|nr:hypothetical protein [Scytonema sp. UIC 10036]